jgi:hypothetical protein
MPDLKPMGFGEILDGALTIFRRHFLLFVKLGVATLWLPVALEIYIQLSGGQQQHVGLSFLSNVIQYFAGLFLTASAIRVISDSYLGQTPQLGDALSLGASKIWSLFVVGLAKALLIGLVAIPMGIAAAIFIPAMVRGGGSGSAVLLLVLAGIADAWLMMFIACGYAVTTPVVVLEGLNSSTESFGRSWNLTRGSKLKIFGIFLVTWLIVFLPVLVIGALGGFLTVTTPIGGEVFQVVAAALPVVLTPLFSCVLTLLYYDLRVRREAFDLEMLSQQLTTLDAR